MVLIPVSGAPLSPRKGLALIFSRRLFQAVALAVAGAAATSASAQPFLAQSRGAEVWEIGLPSFTGNAYAEAVEVLVQDFEKRSGRQLQPGARQKAGLKIYTDSGPGLATPPELVRAVIEALERRGFERQNIFLVGLNQRRLRMSGFLPSLGTGATHFPGTPVYVLESGSYYDPVWFYDSPLPSRYDPLVTERAARAGMTEGPMVTEEDRKSFLATPLLLDADFWINLPVYTDHPVLGINGALVNATLWNASNTVRFFRSPANAPAAVAEMAAIPELKEGWVLNIVSLERYQFIGGPFFNSLYTVSEPRLWMSADPVILDALMLERINRAREAAGFKPLPEDGQLLEFAEQLGVGSQNTTSTRWIRLRLPSPG